MASLVVSGDTSGAITLSAPSVAGTNTLSLPAVTDTLVGLAATQTLTNKTLTSPTFGGTPTGVGVLTSDTAVSASSTSVDFTSIPSWAKRVTVMLNGVSWNNTVSPLIQLGDSGGIETTGYNCISGGTSTTSNASGLNTTAGFNIFGGWSANDVFYGSIIFSLLDVSTNTWAAQGIFSVDTSTQDWGVFVSGTKSLSATLDRVRITSTSAVTFDAGTINILYE